jgi:hypothetical protein
MRAPGRGPGAGGQQRAAASTALHAKADACVRSTRVLPAQQAAGAPQFLAAPVPATWLTRGESLKERAAPAGVDASVRDRVFLTQQPL